MKYNECSYCRRAGSHLCNSCKNANLLLMNDTRQLYYINSVSDSQKGPVEAYLLPYYDVWPESYVWMAGMKDWDFAGNVLDRRLLSVNFNYCPCCNGVFDRNIIYPDDRETIYKCKACGFEFSFGATRRCSEAQAKYVKSFYANTKIDNNFISGMEPKRTSISCDELKRKRELEERCKSVCLPIGATLQNGLDIYKIMGVKEIKTAFILYSARLYHNSSYIDLEQNFEEVELVEQFIASRDLRSKDNKQRVFSSRYCNDGLSEMDFYNYIQKLTNLSIKQISNLYTTKGNRYFFVSNNTQYFVTRSDTIRNDKDKFIPDAVVYGPPPAFPTCAVVYGPPSDVDMHPTVCGATRFFFKERYNLRPCLYGLPTLLLRNGWRAILWLLILLALVLFSIYIIC